MATLSRDDHGRVTRFLTNHCFLKYFEHKIRRCADPFCDECKTTLNEEHGETGYHVIEECERWGVRRRLHLKGKEPRNIFPKELARFLDLKAIKDLEKLPT